MDALTQLLVTSGFMPHGHCFLWTPSLLWTYVLSDAVIAAAYYSIPVALWTFVRRRTDVPFGWVFLMFAVFILACGTTHLMAIWNIWQPVYWLDAGVKAVTAGASIVTAVLLWPLMPRALALPSPSQLEQANSDLRREIGERRRIEQQLNELNAELERRVAQRTAELVAANDELRRTMAERERAEAASRETQELLQAIIDNTAAVICVKDLQGRYLMVNRRFAELSDITNDAAVGKSDADLFPPDVAAAVRAVDRRVTETGSAVVEEEVVPGGEGERTYVSVKAPLRDRHGRLSGVFSISTDITERKRVQDALRESEEHMRLIVDTALDAVITIDKAGVITGWNPQAEAVFGWSRSEAIGRTLQETVIPSAHRAAHARGLLRYLETGEAVVLNRRVELTALRRSGREFPVELSITPLRSGETVSFSAFVRDITERRDAQQRLQAQLERLSLLDQITCAIAQRQDLASIYQAAIRSVEAHLPADFCCVCHYDAVEQVLTVTQVGAHSRSLALELAVGEHARVPVDADGLARCVRGELVYEPDLRALAFAFPRRLARGGLRSLVMAPLQSEEVVFGILVAARVQPDAFVSGECEFLRQLSAHVALAARQAELHGSLQRAYDDLRQTRQAVMQQERLRALGQMASGIAHDINNAISPALIYAESLLERETALSERARGQLETVARAIEDVVATVARMREFYRQGEPQRDLVPLQLNALVQQVVELTRARWSDMPLQRGTVIRLELHLADALPPALGVESEIREALINLVFNAVDAMPEGGVLALRTMAAGTGGAASTMIEVADTGVGMDEDTCRRCFEPFFTTKGERGTGLGMAMVYGVVQRHGADIEIDSEVGRGTTVRVNLPAAPAAATPAPTDAIAMPPRLRILIVDDDPVLLQILQATLEADGHRVMAASSGQAGIDAFASAAQGGEGFSLVMTDLGMPYVDGRKVASAVKRISPTTPVLLLTGWGRGADGEEGIPEHVDEVLSKPPRLRELRQALARHARAAQGGPLMTIS